MGDCEDLLKPIKQQYERGIINDQQAIALLLDKLKESSKEKSSEEYKKFIKFNKLLFNNEPIMNISYKMMPSGNIYKFSKASEHYSLILYSLYKHLSKKEYNNENELLFLMKNALKDKRILEIGCGAGFNIAVLNNLGAKTSGIDIISELSEKIKNIDFKIGDCENLQTIFENEKFEVVYSMDFLTDTILNLEKSKKILKEAADLLKTGGLIINHITYKQVPLPVTILSIWLYSKKTGKDYDLIKEDYFRNNPEILYSNKPSLAKEDYESAGFEVLNFSEDEGEFVVIARKK